jgi:lipopolysaccharide export system permease protein
LLLFFIGAPLGAIIRKGGLGMPVVISIIFFLIFHMSSITGEKLAKTGDLYVWSGMWLSSMILLPIGMFLTYKATTDSSILDAEFYKSFLGKLLKVKFINAWVNRGKNKA